MVLGYGDYRGRGGEIEISSENEGHRIVTPHEVGFRYGYLGTEIRLNPLYGLKLKGIMGLQTAGIYNGLDFGMVFGKVDDSQLTASFSTLADLGSKLRLDFQWIATESLTLLGAAVVTSQPAQTDLGVRLISQVEYKILEFLSLSGNLSYNIRYIDHAGFGAGGGLVYHW